MGLGLRLGLGLGITKHEGHEAAGVAEGVADARDRVEIVLVDGVVGRLVLSRRVLRVHTLLGCDHLPARVRVRVRVGVRVRVRVGVGVRVGLELG